MEPVAISPDGGLIASAGWDADVRVRLWDAASGARVDDGQIDCGSGYLRQLAFGGDGRRLVVMGERSVRVWDTRTRTQLTVIGSSGAYAAAFSPDDSLLILGYGTGLEVLDGRTLAYRSTLSGPAGAIAFAPDGSSFASANGIAPGGPNRVVVWRTEPLEQWFFLDTPSAAVALSYSPDGTRLTVGENLGRVSVWDAHRHSDEPLRTWQAHDGPAYAVTHLNAQRIATGGGDAEIKIWEADTGQLLTTLRGHTDYIHALAVSPDGERLVSGSGDQTVRIWETSPLADRIEAARAAGLRAAPSRSVNRVLELDGNSAIEVEMHSALADLREFTIECWVRAAMPSSTASLISNAEGAGFGLFARLDQNNPRGPFPRGLAYVDVADVLPMAAAAGAWRWQAWTHVALCFDGSALSMYVGGIRVSRFEVFGGLELARFVGGVSFDRSGNKARLSRSKQPLYIGADPGRFGQPSAYFRGTIDELRISRVVRYHGPFTPSKLFDPDPDTLLLLHFDQLIHGLHPDASGQRHHGEPVGFPHLVVEPR